MSPDIRYDWLISGIGVSYGTKEKKSQRILTVCPVPGELMAPLANRIKNLSTSASERISHCSEANLWTFGIRFKSPTVVILEIVHTPFGISRSIQLLVAP